MSAFPESRAERLAMFACYALTALLGLMVIRPDLLLRLLGVIP